VFASIVSVAQDVGYPVLFLLVAIETMGVPVPGETALITGGILASRGHLDLAGVIAFAAAGAIVGDNIGFVLGRRLGRRVLLAPGPFEHHRRRIVEVGEPFFRRHGGKAVFLGRWVTALRITSAWLAGINRMPWPSFLFWNALGGIAWATSFGLLAYSLGQGAERIVHVMGIGGLIAVAVAIVVGWLVVRRRRATAGRAR
jgi:membrane protein DedA with SNARE-associated domain